MAVERHAEHPADDGDGVRLGVVVQELHRAGFGERLEQVAREVARRLAQRLDAAGREGGCDELADARVIGRLEPEEAPALGRPERLPAWIEGRDADLLGGQHVSKVATKALVAQTAAHVLVARHEPALVRLVVEDGCRLAQPVQDGIRILEKAGIGRIEARRLQQRHGANHTVQVRVLGESGGGTK